MHAKKMSGFMIRAFLAISLIFISVIPVFASGAQEEGTTLQFYSLGPWINSDEHGPEYQALVEAFEMENPGVQVELASDSWSDWLNKLPVMASAGNLPDVFLVGHQHTASFGSGDHLLPLDEYVPDEVMDEFFDAVLGMYMWDGEVMALPFTTDARVLFYNKDYFRRAGLDPEAPPETHSELLAMAEELTMDTDDDGRVDVYGFGLDAGLAVVMQGTTMFTATGEWLVSPDTMQSAVDTEGVRTFLSNLRRLTEYSQPDWASSNHQDVVNLFAQGRVAMIWAGPYAYNMAPELLDDPSVGTAMMPYADDFGETGSFGGGFGIAVSRNTENPRLAAELAMSIVSPERNPLLMSDFPARADALENSPYYGDPNYETFFDQLPSVRQNQPKTLAYNEIEEAARLWVGDYLSGNASLEDTIDGLDAEITRLLQ